MAATHSSGRRPHGSLEAEVLATLAATSEPMSAADVQRALPHDLAYNTVQTILIRLPEKDAVQRTPRGRGHVYWLRNAGSPPYDDLPRAAGADWPARQLSSSPWRPSPPWPRSSSPASWPRGCTPDEFQCAF